MKYILLTVLVSLPLGVFAQEVGCHPDDQQCIALKTCEFSKVGLQGFLQSCLDEREKFAEEAANCDVISSLNEFDQQVMRRTLQSKIKVEKANVERLNNLRTRQNRLIERLRKACGSKCAKVR